MNRILIIEDNEAKLNRIRTFLLESYSKIEICDQQSYNSALNEVLYHGKEYDLILLDVSMYTYDINKEDNGGEPEPMAGSSILRYMLLRRIKTPVIVVTMYENFVDGMKIQQLDKRFAKSYPDFYKGYVYYSHKNDDWKIQLKEKIKL